jgi:hypothetical protein
MFEVFDPVIAAICVIDLLRTLAGNFTPYASERNRKWGKYERAQRTLSEPVVTVAKIGGDS